MAERNYKFIIFLGGLIAALAIFVIWIFVSFPLDTATGIFNLISSVALIFGVPVALIQYYQASKKEAEDREYGTYDALDSKYMDFQKLAFDFPELNLFEVPNEFEVELTDAQKKKQLIAYAMLYKILERAFLMYRDQANDIKKKQYEGWQSYIDTYLTRESFQDALSYFFGGYDTDFENNILDKIDELAEEVKINIELDPEAVKIVRQAQKN
jgi:hypothetical protein